MHVGFRIEGRQLSGGPLFLLRFGLICLVTACLSACYVVPKKNRAGMSAVAVNPGSFLGWHGLTVISEVPGSAPLGPIKSVTECHYGSGLDRVSARILSYGDDYSSWCNHDELARQFAAMRDEVRRYSGFDPQIRVLVLRLVPDGTHYRARHWSLSRNRLKLDMALSASPSAKDSFDNTELSTNDARTELVRTLGHEMFHLAVGFSGRFPHDFLTQFHNELAASLMAPCVELAVLGRTRGGTYEGPSKVVVGRYVGSDDQPPEAVEPKTPWIASLMAGIRAERILDDITGDRLIDRESPEARQIFAACSKAVRDYLDTGR